MSGGEAWQGITERTPLPRNPGTAAMLGLNYRGVAPNLRGANTLRVLNPNALPFTPLNPNAQPYYPPHGGRKKKTRKFKTKKFKGKKSRRGYK